MEDSFTLISNGQKQEILVKTCHSQSKVKNLNFFLIFCGESQKKSKTIQLKIEQCSKGQLTTLMNEDGTPFPVVETAEIELWKDDSGSGVEWFCDLITVLDLDTGHSIPFPVERLIRPKIHYRIRAFDTYLPQDDPYPEQRDRELELKKTSYLPNPLLPFVASETKSFNTDEVKLVVKNQNITFKLKLSSEFIFKMLRSDIMLSLYRFICFQPPRNIQKKFR